MSERRTRLDSESMAAIYTGISTHQLAEIFGMRSQDVKKKCAGLEVVGKGPQGNPLYRIADAAARLVKVELTPHQMEATIKRMNHTDVPVLVREAFYKGKLLQLKYEEIAGEYWLTEDVVRVVGAAFQVAKMTLLLAPDNINEKYPMTREQTQEFRGIINTLLENLRNALIDNFRKPGEPAAGLDGEGNNPEDEI